MIRIALALLALVAGAGAAGPPVVRLDADVTWHENVEGFGGFSGFEVLDGGARFVAVSDSGRWATGRMERRDGRLIAAILERSGPLLAIDGTVLTGRDIDAEGLAVDAGGRIYVSFEHFHRIRRYDRIDGPAAPVPDHPAFPRLQENSGLEALAIDADGILYAIPERSGALDRPYPVFRLRDGIWDTDLELKRAPPFLVTGADWGPDGRLYILERDFSLLGFRTRIRRFMLGPEGFDAGETLIETERRELDNMESISVWEDDAGRIRITLISDDNFFPLQRTMFAEYVIEEDHLARDAPGPP